MNSKAKMNNAIFKLINNMLNILWVHPTFCSLNVRAHLLNPRYGSQAYYLVSLLNRKQLRRFVRSTNL